MWAEPEVRGIEPHVDRSGVGVVGRLGAIDVVVGREVLELPRLVSHDLQGTIADHLVSVHVGRRTCTSLDHIHGELLMMLPLEELVAGLEDSVLLGIREES